ncbi:hypothetical protein Tco_0057194, partial [Tanacetum coccineum]
MASPEATTDSRLINTVLIPSLEKIINNSSWRKHSKLGQECKSLLDHLNSPPKSPKSPNSTDSITPGVLYGSGSNELSLIESDL